MDFSRSFAALVGNERILETSMIETNRFSRLRKQVDDGRAAETERVLVDDKVFFQSPVEQYQHVDAARFLVSEKVEQCVCRAATIGIRLIQTEIEKEVLLGKREVFQQQHVSRMHVGWMRQHVVTLFQPNRLDCV